MMAKWTKILPFFIVQWIAKRNCQRVTMQGKNFVWVYADVLIWDKENV